MTRRRFVSKDWKPLEQIIKDKKIKKITLTVIEISETTLKYRLEGDGKEIHTSHFFNHAPPFEIFKLNLKDQKKGFPLELSSIEVNLGLVKAKFDKKTK